MRFRDTLFTQDKRIHRPGRMPHPILLMACTAVARSQLGEANFGGIGRRIRFPARHRSEIPANYRISRQIVVMQWRYLRPRRPGKIASDERSGQDHRRLAQSNPSWPQWNSRFPRLSVLIAPLYSVDESLLPLPRCQPGSPRAGRARRPRRRPDRGRFYRCRWANGGQRSGSGCRKSFA